MKLFKHLLPLALAVLTFAACNDDEDHFEPLQPGMGINGVYVLNQGSQGHIDGTLSYFDFADYKPVHGLFVKANGQSLGDSPQDGVIYGSKLYIAMYGSNLVWAIDANTRKIVGQISTTEPEGITAAGGFIYVSNNDGYVTKIDTTALKVVSKIEVGPNPVDLEARGNYLYVAVSDGYNWEKGYPNGFRLAKIDLKTFTNTKQDVKVGMNPGKMTQDANGNLFVVCNGNYGSIPATIWRVDTADRATEYCKGSMAAAHGNLLYVVNSVMDYTIFTKPKAVINYAVWNTRHHAADTSHSWGKDLAHMPPAPTAINIAPRTGEIYLTSDAKVGNYTDQGMLNIYDRTGKFLRTVTTGVHPVASVFY